MIEHASGVPDVLWFASPQGLRFVLCSTLVTNEFNTKL